MLDRHPTPDQFKARLWEYLTGGMGETFASAYTRLYEDAKLYEHEDDELREAKEELDEVKVALQDANLDLLEARAEIERLKEKAGKKAKPS